MLCSWCRLQSCPHTWGVTEGLCMGQEGHHHAPIALQPPGADGRVHQVPLLPHTGSSHGNFLPPRNVTLQGPSVMTQRFEWKGEL